MSTISAIALAAGQGTRMNSDFPKVAHRCFGEPMIVHVLRGLDHAGVGQINVIVGYERETVKKLLPEDVSTVVQEEQNGTGHAVQIGLEEGEIPDHNLVVVTCGDIPGVRPPTYRKLIEQQRNSEAELTILTARVDDPTSYGRIVGGEDSTVFKIVEEKDATSEEKGIDLINTGIMCAPASVFRKYLPELSADNAAGELYLTDIVGFINEDKGRVISCPVEDAREVTGINTRRQLVEFEEDYYQNRADELLDQGVTVHDRDSVRIGPWVELERDVELSGDITLRGEVTVGKGTRIIGQTIIEHSVLGKRNEIRQSKITHSRLADEVRVGPFCHVRPGSTVGNNVRLGNFVEIKKTSVADDTNISHLSYVGDADIGSGVNLGAGTITCNYDGYDKHTTRIDDSVFVGSNSELVAPVEIGEGALVGAGSTITRDVPPYSLAVSRTRQENKENWVKDVWLPRKERESGD